MGGQILNQLSSADALINVVRSFVDETVPHIEGSLDVDRDIATANLELTLHDLGIISRRLERIEESLKAAKPAERQSLQPEQKLLEQTQGRSGERACPSGKWGSAPRKPGSSPTTSSSPPSPA